ncbi:integrase, catalytic region, zinc finger, CCHC-type containing protein [Tanacetum coccineum]
MARQCTQPKRPRNTAWFKGKAMLAEAQESGQILDEEQLAFLVDPGILDAYVFYCDDVSNAKAVLMANLSNYGSDVISEEKANQEKNNESLTAKLERYKERVKTFEQRLNIDLSTREKMIDSQMDDMIKEKLALKQQIDSLEQNLSNQIKEKESLLQTFTVFKNESKEKESKYMENEIDLEKKIKELDNIVYKVGQSAQTVHMLTKLQVFYDNTHKQALGYQNPFYLKKAPRIKPNLYDGSVISCQHAVMHVIDDEETLILEEVSRSKMLAKQNDPISKEKKVNTTLINYVEVNKLSEDFGKRFVPQQELSVEQALWLQTSNHNTEQSDISPGRIEAPSELPKVSFVNTSLKKLKFHFSKFDTVVKKRITPDAITEGEWGFEHTKAVTEVQIVFNQMKAAVQQWSDVLLSVMNSTTLTDESVNLEMQRSESCDKCFDLDAEILKTQNSYNELLKKYFKNNELKAQLQAKDTTICKLKEHIKFMREIDKEEKVKQDMDDLETINIELKHSVAKLLFENERLHKEIEHLKQIYKDQFDSIKRTRVRTKEHSESLILHLNSKSVENADLKAQIQDKVFVITSLKNDLRKIKRNEIVENAAQIPIATTIAPGMFKLDLDPLAPRITPTKVVHLKATTYHSVETQKPELRVYSRRPKQIKTVGSSKKAKIVESKNANNSEPNHSWGSNATDVSSSSSLVNDRLSKLFSGIWTPDALTYDKEPLSAHELYLKVAFQKNTCFIQNLEGVDLLSGSRDKNLYTISLDDMLKTSPICLLSKASKTKSWLWHRRLSHLNFGTLNKLAKDGLSRGIPKLKF